MPAVDELSASNVHNGLIYDVGMHNGDDTADYLKQGYKVLAIEADPALIQAAEKRFTHQVRTGQLTLLNIGIGERTGTAPFWICDDNSIWNSFFEENASKKGCRHHQIEIQMRRFSEILDEYGTPHYLKIDIEGCDHLCIRDLSGRPLPKFISAEDDGGETPAGIPVILDLLRSVGYKQFKLISQHNHRAITAAEKSTIERLLDKVRSKMMAGEVNRGDSSGPWGDNADGPWLTFDQVVRIYADSKETYRGRPDKPDFWVDWHARV